MTSCSGLGAWMDCAQDGKTPLDVAQEAKMENAVKVLKAHGARKVSILVLLSWFWVRTVKTHCWFV